MELSIRLCGAIWFGGVPMRPEVFVTPGSQAKSFISSFSRNPPPGTTTRLPYALSNV